VGKAALDDVRNSLARRLLPEDRVAASLREIALAMSTGVTFGCCVRLTGTEQLTIRVVGSQTDAAVFSWLLPLRGEGRSHYARAGKRRSNLARPTP
jgi:hypothetical protein